MKTEMDLAIKRKRIVAKTAADIAAVVRADLVSAVARAYDQPPPPAQQPRAPTRRHRSAKR